MRFLLSFFTACVLMSSNVVVAQEQPAKLLTTADVVLNRELSPKNLHIQWIGASDSYAPTREDAIIATDARTGKSRTLITKQEIYELIEVKFAFMPRYAFNAEGNLVSDVFDMFSKDSQNV